MTFIPTGRQTTPIDLNALEQVLPALRSAPPTNTPLTRGSSASSNAVRLIATRVRMIPPEESYTASMTGTAWDAFMNQPGTVAIRQQQAMFMEMREQFYAEYEGKYVAFSNGEILDSDADDSALLVRTRELRRQKYVVVLRVQREYPPAEL